MALWLRPQLAIRCQPRSPGFLIARLHVPRPTAAPDPWQRDLPRVDTPTFKDVPRSVPSQFDDCPLSRAFGWNISRRHRVRTMFRHASAGNQSHDLALGLYDAGLHNRSRIRARNWVHSRIWRSRDYVLSTPPTPNTGMEPFLRLR
jgi:hypothetical protein